MKTLITVLFLIFYGILSSQNIPEYYYSEIATNDTTKYEISYGIFSKNDHKVRKLPSHYRSREIFMNSVKDKLASLPEDKRNILIYIHGMWAHRDYYQEEVLTKFEEDILSSDNNPYGVVISMIWYSGLSYFSNVDQANAVGRYYYSLFNDILSIETDKKSIICHSMGNRVFQGMISQIPSLELYPYKIDQVIFAAADLEENIFDQGEPLDSIGTIVMETIIYVHNNDRSLGMSKALNENARLGLNADGQTCKDNTDIIIVDVSTVNDDEGIGPSLSHHRYFYSSPTVRNDIRLFLHNQPNPDRIEIDCGRRFKLSTLDSNQQ